MANASSFYTPGMTNTQADPAVGGQQAAMFGGMGMGGGIPWAPRASLSSAYELAGRTTVPQQRRMSFTPEARGMSPEELEIHALKTAGMKQQLQRGDMEMQALNSFAPQKVVGTGFNQIAGYQADPAKMSALQRQMFLPNHAGMQGYGGNIGVSRPQPQGAMREAMGGGQPEPTDADVWQNFQKNIYNPPNRTIPTDRQRIPKGK